MVSMKSFKSFVTEKKFADLKPTKGKWTNIPNSEFDPELSAQLYDLIDKSYSYVGGHANYRTANDLPLGKDKDDSSTISWYALDFDDDPEADVLNVTKKTKFGDKSVLGATDGSKEAKHEYVMNMVKKLNQPGNYAEVSDAIMHILLTRYGVPTVDNKEDVEKILGKKVEWIGPNPDNKYPGHNGFYARQLGGTRHIKIMLGKPNLS